MIHARKTQDAIESCRPGSNDLAAPEMAELASQVEQDAAVRAEYSRVQRQDEIIAHAFHDVALPAGLHERLLAALASKSASDKSTADADPTNSNSGATVTLTPKDEAQAAELERRQARSRRWWLSSTAVAATAILAAGIWFHWESPPTTEELSRLAQDWTNKTLLAEQSTWQPFDEAQFPRLRWRPYRWRKVSTSLDRNAVVFDFRFADGSRLLLFQLKPSQAIPLPSLPYQPLSSTGAWRQGAWREGDSVYIAVTNNPRLLDSLRSGVEATLL